MYDDDDIVDAEIIDDVPSDISELLPAGWSGGTEVAVREAPPSAYRDPPGVIRIPLSAIQRQTIRAALAHYHDNGPRERSTHLTLSTLNWVADHEVEQNCDQCSDTGKYRTMHGMYYCHCPKGVERRSNND